MSKLGRRARYVIALDDGQEVGYSPRPKDGLFRVLFKNPFGKVVEPSTGVEVPKGWNKKKPPPAEWFAEAAKAIKKAYTLPNDDNKKDHSKASWDDAETYLMSLAKRSGSRRTYRSAYRMVKAAMSDLTGPAEVTPERAGLFISKYVSEPYRRSKSESGKLRPRGFVTANTILRNLSVSWNRLKKKKLVQENVWSKEHIERFPVPKKEPRIPDEDAFVFFLDWLDKRFPGPDGKGWPLLRAFIDVKSIMGCRLYDLSQVETWQYDKLKKKLLITAEQDKTNQERSIRLPENLAAEVENCCGPKFLWERYVIDSATYRPGIRRATEFRPSVMYHAIQSIFREYNLKHPDKKVRNHDFRRRAVTLLTKAYNGDLDAVSKALNITVETARRHYLDQKKARDQEEMQKMMPGVLLIKRRTEGEATQPDVPAT